MTDREREREREERERERERERDRERERERGGKRRRQRHIYMHTHRNTHTHTKRERDRETKREREMENVHAKGCTGQRPVGLHVHVGPVHLSIPTTSFRCLSSVALLLQNIVVMCAMSNTLFQLRQCECLGCCGGAEPLQTLL